MDAFFGTLRSLFGSRQKTPRDNVRLLVVALENIRSDDAHVRERAQRSASKRLAALRDALAEPAESARAASGGHGGSSGASASSRPASNRPASATPGEVLAEVAHEAYAANLFGRLVDGLGSLEFEARKSAVSVFNALVRRRVVAREPTVEYICAGHAAVVHALLRGCGDAGVALHCGLMVRECVRHEALAAVVLQSDEFLALFEYVQLPTFDVASDAFATLRDALTRHRMLGAAALVARYDELAPRLEALLRSTNYVTRRQSVKLLGELLLERANYDFMARFVSSGEHLKTMMNLLRDPSRNIQLEAFHVFKVFAGNPNKSRAVHDILAKNRDRLVAFLEGLAPARADDTRFLEERAYIARQIEALEPRPPSRLSVPRDGESSSVCGRSSPEAPIDAVPPASVEASVAVHRSRFSVTPCLPDSASVDGAPSHAAETLFAPTANGTRATDAHWTPSVCPDDSAQETAAAPHVGLASDVAAEARPDPESTLNSGGCAVGQLPCKASGSQVCPVGSTPAPKCPTHAAPNARV